MVLAEIAERVPLYRGHDARRDRRRGRALAGARGVARGGARDPRRASLQLARRRPRAPPTADGRLAARSRPLRDLWAHGRPSARPRSTSCGRAGARAPTRRRRRGSASATATQVEVASNGHVGAGDGARCATAARPGAALADRGHRGATTRTCSTDGPPRRVVEVRRRRERVSLPARRHPVRRDDRRLDRQVARDLRARAGGRADDPAARAQAARPLPEPLRAQPRRPLRPAAAARRRAEAAQQGAVLPAAPACRC